MAHEFHKLIGFDLFLDTHFSLSIDEYHTAFLLLEVFSLWFHKLCLMKISFEIKKEQSNQEYEFSLAIKQRFAVHIHRSEKQRLLSSEQKWTCQGKFEVYGGQNRRILVLFLQSKRYYIPLENKSKQKFIMCP